MKLGTITWELASDLMDAICILIACGTGEIRENETRQIFQELCDRYNIIEVVESEGEE